VAATPAVSHLAGRPLADFSIIDAGDVRANFDDWNTLGLTATEAHAAAEASERGGDGEVAPGVSAGFSTGSAGARGVFLTSGAERAQYVGRALAKLVPLREAFKPLRVALCLRADNRLYRDAGQGGRVRFKFFALDDDAAQRADDLAAFAPDVLIAPAQVLADLALRAERDGFRLPFACRLFWGAEPMGAAERAWIAEALGVRPDPIYQATEGFLGAPCRYGTLHLNEDAMVVELEPVRGTDRFRPIVTDLFRASQPMIRVRLDDLISPLPAPCACGSPLQAIAPVDGQVGDRWRFGDRVICPREVEAVMETALGPRASWSATANASTVTVATEASLEDLASAAIRRLGPPSHIEIRAEPFDPATLWPKRRRVRWAP
jgi:putative adenylate-forming enzyme